MIFISIVLTGCEREYQSYQEVGENMMKKLLMIIAAMLLVPTLVKADETVFENMSDEEKIDELIQMVIELQERVEELEAAIDDETGGEEQAEDEEISFTQEEMHAMNFVETWNYGFNWSKEEMFENLLIHEEGPEITEEVAEVAVEHADIDYAENALALAEEYLIVADYSEKELYELLTEEHGFTEEEAEYAIDNLEE